MKGQKINNRQMCGILACCALPLVAWTAPVPAEAPAAKDLRLAYKTNCEQCHGPDGTAKDATGKQLKGQDFTDVKWRQNTKDEEMVKTIQKGRFFGLAMPSFKDILTKDEAQRMVTEIIRTSEKGKVIEPAPPAPSGKPVATAPAPGAP
jgi:mono/diheme cytochrome c family protein